MGFLRWVALTDRDGGAQHSHIVGRAERARKARPSSQEARGELVDFRVERGGVELMGKVTGMPPYPASPMTGQRGVRRSLMFSASQLVGWLRRGVLHIHEREHELFELKKSCPT